MGGIATPRIDVSGQAASAHSQTQILVTSQQREIIPPLSRILEERDYRLRLRVPRRLTRAPRTADVVAALLSGLLLGWVTASGRTHLAIALSASGVLASVTLTSRRAGVVATIAWLAFLGLFRRLVSALGAGAQGTDPLLLVAPLAAGLLAALAVQRGALRKPTPLTRAVLALAGLAVLGVLNPRQGGLQVGLGGLLFTLVPMLWFPVGRAFRDSSELVRVYRTVGWLSVAAAVYGIMQVLVGFPPYDQLWIEEVGYNALNVRGTIRPFSTFASGLEYASFVAVGLLAFWVPRMRTAPHALRLAPIVLLLGVAVVLQGSRGIVVIGTVTVGLLIAARQGAPAGKAFLVGLVAAGVLFVAVGRWGPEVDATSPSGALLAHQVGGLRDPLNPEESTAALHTSMLVKGTAQGLREPLGRGTGAVTIAGGKFGGVSESAEGDPGNAGLAWGVLGLLAYAALVALAMPRAYRLARTRRDAASLGALAVLAATFLQWFNGGQYAVAPLVWLTLGWLDRPPPEE